MKKVNWIIDKDIFEEYEERLVDSIKKSGSNVYFYDELVRVNSKDYSVDDFKNYMLNKFTDKDIVVFHGSLEYSKKLSHLPIYPGTFLTLENFECYNYYGYFGDYLLNSNYMMMGLNDVLRNKDRLVDNLFANESFFIRPSNGYKSFPGQILNYDNFESEFDILIKSYAGLDMNTLVLLSRKQELEEEYRFIVVDGEVISGSQYFDKDNIGTFKPYYDRVCENDKAIEFAIKMSKLYQPDKAYTIDICKTKNNEYKLLELNSFNCASMYGNDYDKVVEAINKLAIKEYNDLFEI